MKYHNNVQKVGGGGALKGDTSISSTEVDRRYNLRSKDSVYTKKQNRMRKNKNYTNERLVSHVHSTSQTLSFNLLCQKR